MSPKEVTAWLVMVYDFSCLFCEKFILGMPTIHIDIQNFQGIIITDKNLVKFLIYQSIKSKLLGFVIHFL